LILFVYSKNENDHTHMYLYVSTVQTTYLTLEI